MKKVIHTSGKRKTAIARATLKNGTGRVIINGKNLDKYAPELYKLRIKEPLLLAGNLASKVNISVKVFGGGYASQTDAIRLAIARALAEHDEKLKSTFMDYDRLLLVADVRRKEPTKPNRQGKARSKRQKSYR